MKQESKPHEPGNKAHEEAQALCAESVCKFNALFDVAVQAPEIRVFNSRAQIDAYKNQATEDWLVGWYDQGLIYLLNKNAFAQESSRPTSDFPKVLTHELLHHYFQQMVGHTKPAWLSEGFSLYFAEQPKHEPPEKEKMKLAEYASHWNKNGYAVAYFWVSHLIQKFGLIAFIQFIKEIGATEQASQSYEAKFDELFYERFHFHPDSEGTAHELASVAS